MIAQRMVIVALAITSAPHIAHAQSVDYGTLEALFGEPITTSATGTPQRVSDAPANMTIITADEIRQSGSRSIPQILSRVPGLDILQEGVNSYDVGVRGYQQPFQPRLLVLVDGRQVFINDYSRTIWENIPVNVDDIRQIEVVKGAASALFGSNAAGGVINIVTYSPIYDNSNVASASIGTQNEFTGDGTATVKGDWGGSKTSAGGLKADEFDTPHYSGDEPTQQAFHRYISNNTVVQVAPHLQANMETNFSDSRGLTGDPTDFGTTAEQRTTTYSAGVGANWQSPLGLITNNNYFNHSFVDLFETTSGVPGGMAAGGSVPYGLTTDLLLSQIQDQFRIGADHTFRTGVEYSFKAFKNDGVQAFSQAPSVDEGAAAVSGSWLWRINDQWSWTNAARLDHTELQETGTLLANAYVPYDEYSHTINAFSANSDLVYKPTELDSFRLGYGRGVQLPSLMNNAWDIILVYGAAGLNDYEGNPNLKPTIVQDYSLDYDRQIKPISSDIKFSVYYELNQDVVAPFVTVNSSTVDGAPINIAQNVGNSGGLGGEIELKGSVPLGFRWDASYSYTHLADSTGVKSYDDYNGSAPVHHGRLLLGYTKDRWEFDTNGQIVSGTDMLRSTNGGATQFMSPQGGYTSLAGRIGYKVTDTVTAAISGTNFTRQVTTETAYPAVDRQALLTVTARF